MLLLLRRFGRRIAVTGLLAALPALFLSYAPLPLSAQAASGSPPSAVPDTKVWVNTSSGVYHCPGSRYYGSTKAGKYFSESQARSRGYRPAYGKVCTPLLGKADSVPRPTASLKPPDSGPKVWVNTSSGVYHCSGSRYYGTTKRGEYMSEGRARGKGYRPAYGRACS